MPTEAPSADAPRVLILVAAGSEEIETIVPGDVLVRAGCAVTYAGLGSTALTGSRGLPLAADTTIEDLAASEERFDALVIPGGGEGAKNLGASAAVRDVLIDHAEAGALIAAICAAPAAVLAPAGLLDGRRATCYPGWEQHFRGSTTHETARVVVDDGVITSRGPGTAFDFALTIAAELRDPETARGVAEDMLLPIRQPAGA